MTERSATLPDMPLDDDDKRWIAAQLERMETRLLTEGRVIPRGPQREPRGTVYEPGIHGPFCRYCGETYDRHKAYPRGECQDAVRQG